MPQVVEAEEEQSSPETSGAEFYPAEVVAMQVPRDPREAGWWPMVFEPRLHAVNNVKLG
jgi:hypothetical protein